MGTEMSDVVPLLEPERRRACVHPSFKKRSYGCEKKNPKRKKICLTVGGISTVRINCHALYISGDVQTEPALIEHMHSFPIPPTECLLIEKHVS